MKIITICGSLKFQNEIMKIAERLSLEGHCILTPIYPVTNLRKTDEQIKYLKEEHFKKIELSDEILVVNINNYIGESTSLEIEYAKKLNKEIIYYTDLYKDKYRENKTINFSRNGISLERKIELELWLLENNLKNIDNISNIFNNDEVKYLLIAQSLPYTEVLNDLIYFSKHHEIDELKYVNELAVKYNTNNNILFKRIKDVKSIYKYSKKNKKKNEEVKRLLYTN